MDYQESVGEKLVLVPWGLDEALRANAEGMELKPLEKTNKTKIKIMAFLVVLYINLSEDRRWFRVISARGRSKNYRTSSP